MEFLRNTKSNNSWGRPVFARRGCCSDRTPNGNPSVSYCRSRSATTESVARLEFFSSCACDHRQAKLVSIRSRQNQSGTGRSVHADAGHASIHGTSLSKDTANRTRLWAMIRRAISPRRGTGKERQSYQAHTAGNRWPAMTSGRPVMAEVGLTGACGVDARVGDAFMRGQATIAERPPGFGTGEVERGQGGGAAKPKNCADKTHGRTIASAKKCEDESGAHV